MSRRGRIFGMNDARRFPVMELALSMLLLWVALWAVRFYEDAERLRGELAQLGRERYRLERSAAGGVEVYRGGELLREYEPRDGDVYRELVGIMEDTGD